MAHRRFIRTTRKRRPTRSSDDADMLGSHSEGIWQFTKQIQPYVRRLSSRKAQSLVKKAIKAMEQASRLLEQAQQAEYAEE